MRAGPAVQLLAAAAAMLGCAEAGPGVGFAVPLERESGGPGGWGWASTANCTWKFITQPLNHFSPDQAGPTFQERYCIFDGFWETARDAGFSSPTNERA